MIAQVHECNVYYVWVYVDTGPMPFDSDKKPHIDAVQTKISKKCKYREMN